MLLMSPTDQEPISLDLDALEFTWLFVLCCTYSYLMLVSENNRTTEEDDGATVLSSGILFLFFVCGLSTFARTEVNSMV